MASPAHVIQRSSGFGCNVLRPHPPQIIRSEAFFCRLPHFQSVTVVEACFDIKVSGVVLPPSRLSIWISAEKVWAEIRRNFDPSAITGRGVE